MRFSSEHPVRCGLLTMAALLLAAMPPGSRGEKPARVAAADSVDEGDDDDSDSAPFMIVVEHDEPAPWRCSGSLVSMRTGVTSAWCARDREPADAARDLWAVAASAAAGQASRTDGARRVSRVATAGAGGLAQEEGAASWAGAPLDLAVLELEAPFGSGAHARPILMATSPDECVGAAPGDAPGDARAVCHVVRALPRDGSARSRLRIVDAKLAAEDKCAAAARFWTAVRARALCLGGPEMCASDRGAGVVCGGKLCGVLSRSAREGDATGGLAGAGCGDTHVAQSVARWRRFLHCAHTLRACGRGTCADMCSERRLLDDAEAPAPAGNAGAPAAERPPSPKTELPTSLEVYTAPEPPPRPASSSAPAVSRVAASTRPRASPRRPVPTRTSAARKSKSPAAASAALSPPSVRPSPLFEPNRPDFKAGEYGDNAAEYGVAGEEASPASPSPPTRSPPTPSPAGDRLTAAMRRVAPPAAPLKPVAQKRSAAAPFRFRPLVLVYASLLFLYSC